MTSMGKTTRARVGAATAKGAARPESTLRFHLNGRPVEVGNPDPTTRLVDFLHAQGLTGTKIGCGEGGCGACTVTLSWYDRQAKVVRHRAVNSCLRPLCAMEGMAVTTVEGVGDLRHGVHPVQHAIAAGNGSQCGYCTPGFVMNMFSFLQEEPSPDLQQIEDRFDGHVCRCTGYRPILHGVRSFAPGGDPDDRHTPACGETPAQVAVQDPPRTPSFPAGLKALRPRFLRFEGSGHVWLRPRTLAEAQALKAQHGGAGKVKLVGGNTALGIYKDAADNPPVLIDVSHLGELRGIRVMADGLRIGAGTTYQELLDFLDERLPGMGSKGAGWESVRALVKRTANVQVRSVATVGGNLMLVLEHARRGMPFPSDLFTGLAAMGAKVLLGSRRWVKPREHPVLEVPPVDAWPSDAVVLGFHVPYARPGERFGAYKVARRIQNAHGIVNAGFRVALTKGLVTDVALVYGGIGRVALRAAATEKALLGRAWNVATLRAVTPVLRKEMTAALAKMPEEGISEAYRLSLTATLLYKFFVEVALDVDPSSVPPQDRLAGEPYVRPVSTAQQSFGDDVHEFPVSEPLLRLTAFAQATGEAVYTNDVPLPPRTLFAAFVLSARAHATFTWKRDPERLAEELRGRFPGFHDLVTAKDAPNPKSFAGIGGDDVTFAVDRVTCAGQCIAMAVADTEALALKVAAHVQSTAFAYKDLPAVLTIADALRLPDGRGLFKDNPPTASYLSHLSSMTRPGSDETWLRDPSRPMPGTQVARGEQETGAQAQFYMETQSVLVVPAGVGTFQVHSATQDAALIQQAVSSILGISASAVDVHVKLLGGGFGGKTTRTPFVAGPVAVAAWKLNRPVRLAINRNVDLAMIGKRHPFLGRYHVAFTPEGRIHGLSADFWSDGGNTYDCSFFVMDTATFMADNAYMVPTYRTTGQVARTNLPSNNAMRAFGVIQASLVMEDAIEQAAHALGMRPDEVREANFYRESDGGSHFDRTPYGQALRYYDMRKVWDRLKKTSDYERRHEAVQAFNRENRWRKRGISLIPLKYGVSYTTKMLDQGGALVNAYAVDGSVLVQCGAIEMGQGIQTKMVQIAAQALGIPMARIRIAETEPDVVPNAVSTGASTGSDLNGGAVDKAGRALRKRLEDFCRTQGAQGEKWLKDWAASWPAVVQAAWGARIDLSSQALFATPHLSEVDAQHPHGHPFYYYTYSAAVSEVEIDVLTGETTILRADVLYDAGEPLNPCLDLGQVEGGFVQGIGNVTTEEVVFDDKGRLATDGTWTYKPPCTKTIPLDFRVRLLRRTRLDKDGKRISPAAVHSSKSSGEPPLVLSNTVFFAIKHAVLAARADRGRRDWFHLPSPATVQRIQQACLVGDDDLETSPTDPGSRATPAAPGGGTPGSGRADAPASDGRAGSLRGRRTRAGSGPQPLRIGARRGPGASGPPPERRARRSASDRI